MNRNKKLSLPLRILLVMLVLITMSLFTTLLSNIGDSGIVNGDTSNDTSHMESNSDACILVDTDSLKVSFIGAEDASAFGVFYVTLKVENKTDTTISINLEDADVDGETIPMITTGVPLIIRPGNSGQTSFIFSMVNLSISTMGEAQKATFQIVARDNASYNVVYESELVTIDLH